MVKLLNKVVVIEDNKEVSEAISMALEIRWPDVKILLAEKGESGLMLIEKESPDLLLLDLYLPDISGYDVLKQVRMFSNVPVIIITVRSEEANVIKGFELGADDYIVKPFKQLELLSRIKAILRRCTQTCEEEIITRDKYRLNTTEQSLTYNTSKCYLTATETQILYKLMSNAGHIVSRRSIAEELWGTDYSESYVSIKTYIRRIRIKIEKDPGKPELIITRKGIGYYWKSNK